MASIIYHPLPEWKILSRDSRRKRGTAHGSKRHPGDMLTITGRHYQVQDNGSLRRLD